MSLNNILANMDSSLFEDDEQNESKQGNILYEEDISLEVAKSLLPPEEFQSHCTYRMITMYDSTVITKLDKTVSVTEENPKGETLTEYVLEQNTEDVMSIRELTEQLDKSYSLHTDKLEVKKSKPWFVIALVTLSVFLLIGILLLVFVLKFM